MRKELLAVASVMALAMASGTALAGDDNNDIVGNFGALNDTVNDSDDTAINSSGTQANDHSAVVQNSGNTAVVVHVEDIGVAVSSNSLSQGAIQVNAQTNLAGGAFVQANAMNAGGVSIGSGNDIVGSGVSANTGFNALQGSQSAFSVGVGDIN